MINEDSPGLRLLSASVLFFAFSLLIGVTIASADTVTEWKEVERAKSKRLPQTAIEHLDNILSETKRNNKLAEWLKAFLERITQEASLKGRSAAEPIKLLQEKLPEVPQNLLPIANAVLAKWYWGFFSQNRWMFVKRTQTISVEDSDNVSNESSANNNASAKDNDFTTWSLARLFQEIDKKFTDALSDKKKLADVSISSLYDFLDRGSLPEDLRPTLYDFIAHEALTFYESNEQAGARPEDYFQITENSKAMGNLNDFLSYVPQTTDTDSPTLKAILLYQDLLRAHKAKGNAEALVDLDMARLAFVKNSASGENTNRLYIARLEEIIRQYPKLERAQFASYKLARAYGEEGDALRAHQIAEECVRKNETSVGGKSCSAFIKEIELKSLSISLEKSIPSRETLNKAIESPRVHVSYKNFTTLYFRIVPDVWDRFMSKKWGHPEFLTSLEIDEVLKQTPIEEWKVKLEPTTDFQEHVTDVKLPQLHAGYYRIFASAEPDFRSSQMIQHASFWVSDYTIVSRSLPSEIGGLVLEAVSGNPVSKATVKLVSRKDEKFIYDGQAQTDENGWFSMVAPIDSYEHHLYVSCSGQELFQTSAVSSAYYSPPNNENQVVFFTDRALYRPGQTINFKGILVKIDEAANNYQTLAKQRVTVVLKDANYQDVSRETYETNELGSFSGRVTAPTDRLLGSMSLGAEGIAGSAVVRVEEYKRPKFFVQLENLKQAGRLNEMVTITGKAENYTGAPIDQASVRYRVRREVRWPWWCYYCLDFNRSGSQEIGHGQAEIDSNGVFHIPFQAKPDLDIDPSDDPTFQYTVEADVTASDGETRSAKVVIDLGYSALAIKLKTPEMMLDQQSFNLDISTETLDGAPLPTEQGEIKIFALKQPKQPIAEALWGKTPRVVGPQNNRANQFDKSKDPNRDKSDWREWENAKTIASFKLRTVADKASQTVALALPQGLYRIEVVAQDSFGKEVKALYPIVVLPKGDSAKFEPKIPSVAKVADSSVKVGDSLNLIWGTGYTTGRALIEIEHRGQTLKKFWTKSNSTALTFSFPVNADLRGGFIARVTQVRENRAYLSNFSIAVPWDNKTLDIRTEVFRDKIRPGEKEVWKIKVHGEKQEEKAIELAATLYDSSLDQFYPHSWDAFSFFPTEYDRIQSSYFNFASSMQILRDNWNTNNRGDVPNMSYTRFPSSVDANFYYYGGTVRRKGIPGGPVLQMQKADRALERPVDEMVSSAPLAIEDQESTRNIAKPREATSTPQQQDTQPDIPLRTNLQETAFFYPQLLLEEDGSVSLSFTVPDALTKWKFLSFAHSPDCASGVFTGFSTTQKELMVQPNAPRFMREGDELWFSAKVTNMTPEVLFGKVSLDLKSALTDSNLNADLGLIAPEQEITLPAKGSRSFSWRLKIPKGVSPVSYRVSATTGAFSDGEIGMIPVLSSRVYLTESLPLAIRGPQSKSFFHKTMSELFKSSSFDPQRFTLQVASNPAWYAVQALPYLMEYPYECSEQVFNRLSANSLAAHIANSNPRIRQVFDIWRGSNALKSNLEKNQQLHSVTIEETPWVLDAQSESQSKERVGKLFEASSLRDSIDQNYRKLQSMQLSNGAWPWFPGGRPDSFITLYLVSGFGRLKNMGIEPRMDMVGKSIDYLDEWISDTYQQVKEKKQDIFDSNVALYLYARSFFKYEKPIAGRVLIAINYFMSQANKQWTKLNSRMSEAHVALAANRLGERNLATEIAKSLKERSLTSEEMGRFWRDEENSWWWYRAPLETQASMIEVFSEITSDTQAVEDCKVWLLKQKQTQNWRTTKATADAIYALLKTGNDLLKNDEVVEATLGQQAVRPFNVEAGTGFYEVSYAGKDINAQFSQISLTKKKEGIAWGGAHLQYFEEMAKVAPHNGPLALEKQLYIKSDSKKGAVLIPLKGPVKVGDLLIVKITLKVDRDLEYVHLKDGRGSGLEPLNVLSQYKYQDGLYYYESTRDTATHFFIDYLPRGTYVFEYPLQVQLKGRYQSGLAEIQCMYAPEFNSHSQSVEIEVETN